MHRLIFMQRLIESICYNVSQLNQMTLMPSASSNSIFLTESSYQLLMASMDSISLISSYPPFYHESYISTQTHPLSKLPLLTYQSIRFLQELHAFLCHLIISNISC